jgi:hypothetical protein
MTGVLFDCSWPAGTIRAIPSADTAAGNSIESGGTCPVWTLEAAVFPGPVAEPFVEHYWPASDLPLSAADVCIPSRCVFDTPGQPATCSSDCSADLTITYTTDRTRCPTP